MPCDPYGCVKGPFYYFLFEEAGMRVSTCLTPSEATVLTQGESRSDLSRFRMSHFLKWRSLGIPLIWSKSRAEYEIDGWIDASFTVT